MLSFVNKRWKTGTDFPDSQDFFLKFTYSEKTTKFGEIPYVFWHNQRKDSQIVMAFSENFNFTWSQKLLHKTSKSFSEKHLLKESFGEVWVFWEGHKIWRKSWSYFWQEHQVLCARNSVFVKESTKIFQNKCGQVLLYKLYVAKFSKLNW